MSHLNCMNPGCAFREDKKLDENGDEVFPTLKSCGACKKVAYCSKACQTIHWPSHKPICRTLSKSQSIPTVDTLHHVQDEMEKALNGKHAPASQRLRHHSLDETNSDTTKVKKFIAQLDLEQISQYAFQKCLEVGGGAVLFNVNHPVPHVEGSGRFIWVPYGAMRRTGDLNLQRLVSGYDADQKFVMLFVIPAEDGLSADVWPVEQSLVLEEWMRQQIQVMTQFKRAQLSGKDNEGSKKSRRK